MKKLMMMASLLVMLGACTGQDNNNLTVSGLDPKNFVTEVDSIPIELYTLTNDKGMEVCITNFGGRVVSVMVPDRDGKLQDVVLGFDSIGDYLHVEGNNSARSLAAMVIASSKASSRSTARTISCRRTTMGTACMVAPRDSMPCPGRSNRPTSSTWS